MRKCRSFADGSSERVKSIQCGPSITASVCVAKRDNPRPFHARNIILQWLSTIVPATSAPLTRPVTLKRSSGPSLGWALADKECGDELVLVSPVEGRVRREADFRWQRESLEGLGRREGRSPGLASSSSGSGRGIPRDQLDLAAKNASLRIDLFDRELIADQFGFCQARQGCQSAHCRDHVGGAHAGRRD